MPAVLAAWAGETERAMDTSIQVIVEVLLMVDDAVAAAIDWNGTSRYELTILVALAL